MKAHSHTLMVFCFVGLLTHDFSSQVRADFDVKEGAITQKAHSHELYQELRSWLRPLGRGGHDVLSPPSDISIEQIAARLPSYTAEARRLMESGDPVAAGCFSAAIRLNSLATKRVFDPANQESVQKMVGILLKHAQEGEPLAGYLVYVWSAAYNLALDDDMKSQLLDNAAHAGHLVTLARRISEKRTPLFPEEYRDSIVYFGVMAAYRGKPLDSSQFFWILKQAREVFSDDQLSQAEQSARSQLLKIDMDAVRVFNTFYFWIEPEVAEQLGSQLSM